MTKVIGLNVWLEDHSVKSDNYMECVNDLLECEQVKRLDGFTQHCNTSRLQHCINVSYYSYRICRALRGLGFDFVSAARAGILHDLFLYDWRECCTKMQHAVEHPKAALKNAMEITKLNNIETDAISRHMFPFCAFPRYKESYVVSIADKYCAVVEVVSAFCKKLKKDVDKRKSA